MASKERERSQFEAFADAIGRPDLKAAQDGESPDFVVNQDGSRLGIDVAEVFSDQQSVGGSPSRAEESAFARFRSGVVAALEQRFPNAPVGLGWHWTMNLRGIRNDVVARAVEELAKLVEAALPTMPEGSERLLWEADGADAQPSALEALVDEVTLYHLPGVKKPQVSAPLVGWADNQLSDEVRALIAQKEQLRARLYGKLCDRCWLVLAATGINRKSMVDLPQFEVTDLPETGFERIYIFDEFAKNAKLLTKSS